MKPTTYTLNPDLRFIEIGGARVWPRNANGYDWYPAAQLCAAAGVPFDASAPEVDCTGEVYSGRLQSYLSSLGLQPAANPAPAVPMMTYTLHDDGTLEIGGKRILPISGGLVYFARLICAAAQIEFDEDSEWVLDGDFVVHRNHLTRYLASLGLQPTPNHTKEPVMKPTTYTIDPQSRAVCIGGERIVPLLTYNSAYYRAQLICAAAQIEFDEDNEWVDGDGDVHGTDLTRYLASLGLQPTPNHTKEPVMKPTTYTIDPQSRAVCIGGERIVPRNYHGQIFYFARLICAAAQIEFDEDNEWVDGDGEVNADCLPSYLESMGLQPATSPVPVAPTLEELELVITCGGRRLVRRGLSVSDLAAVMAALGIE